MISANNFKLDEQDKDAKSLRTYLSNLYLKPKMEIYLRQELIRPIRVQDLMFERRKYGLPTKKFRSHAKAKIVELKEKKKKIEMKLTKVKGQVNYKFLKNSKFKKFKRIKRKFKQKK